MITPDPRLRHPGSASTASCALCSRTQPAGLATKESWRSYRGPDCSARAAFEIGGLHGRADRLAHRGGDLGSIRPMLAVNVARGIEKWEAAEEVARALLFGAARLAAARFRSARLIVCSQTRQRTVRTVRGYLPRPS